MKNRSYVFYESFHEATKDLSDEEYGKIMRVINEYSLNEVMPEFSEDDSIVKMAFYLIKPQIDANFERRKIGKLGGRRKNIEKVSESEKPSENLLENVSENASNDVKEETRIEDEKQTESLNLETGTDPEKKKKKFVKPTIEELQAYIIEHKYSFSAERFFNYYESKGWLIGKSPMKDWKAACRTWNGNNYSPQKTNISRDTENIDEFASFFNQKQ